MILTCCNSDEEDTFEDEKEIIKNVMVITVDSSNVKKRYFLGSEPKINTKNLFAFDVKYSEIFKGIKDQNDEFFYEKFKHLKAESLNVSVVGSNSVIESTISKEDNYINSDVLNLINSPVNFNKTCNEKDYYSNKNALKEENLFELLNEKNHKTSKEINQVDYTKISDKTLGMKNDLFKEIKTDEEKDFSPVESFSSDLSQIKNYIPKEMLFMKNNVPFDNKNSNLNLQLEMLNQSNLKGSFSKKPQMNPNAIINYYDFNKILNDPFILSPKNTNTIMCDSITDTIGYENKNTKIEIKNSYNKDLNLNTSNNKNFIQEMNNKRNSFNLENKSTNNNKKCVQTDNIETNLSNENKKYNYIDFSDLNNVDNLNLFYPENNNHKKILNIKQQLQNKPFQTKSFLNTKNEINKDISNEILNNVNKNTPSNSLLTHEKNDTEYTYNNKDKKLYNTQNLICIKTTILNEEESLADSYPFRNNYDQNSNIKTNSEININLNKNMIIDTSKNNQALSNSKEKKQEIIQILDNNQFIKSIKAKRKRRHKKITSSKSQSKSSILSNSSNNYNTFKSLNGDRNKTISSIDKDKNNSNSISDSNLLIEENNRTGSSKSKSSRKRRPKINKKIIDNDNKIVNNYSTSEDYKEKKNRQNFSESNSSVNILKENLLEKKNIENYYGKLHFKKNKRVDYNLKEIDMLVKNMNKDSFNMVSYNIDLEKNRYNNTNYENYFNHSKNPNSKVNRIDSINLENDLNMNFPNNFLNNNMMNNPINLNQCSKNSNQKSNFQANSNINSNQFLKNINNTSTFNNFSNNKSKNDNFNPNFNSSSNNDNTNPNFFEKNMKINSNYNNKVYNPNIISNGFTNSFNIQNFMNNMNPVVQMNQNINYPINSNFRNNIFNFPNGNLTNNNSYMVNNNHQIFFNNAQINNNIPNQNIGNNSINYLNKNNFNNFGNSNEFKADPYLNNNHNCNFDNFYESNKTNNNLSYKNINNMINNKNQIQKNIINNDIKDRGKNNKNFKEKERSQNHIINNEKTNNFSELKMKKNFETERNLKSFKEDNTTINYNSEKNSLSKIIIENQDIGINCNEKSKIGKKNDLEQKVKNEEKNVNKSVKKSCNHDGSEILNISKSKTVLEENNYESLNYNSNINSKEIKVNFEELFKIENSEKGINVKKNIENNYNIINEPNINKNFLNVNNEDIDSNKEKKNKQNINNIIKSLDYLNMNDDELANVAIIICRDQAGCRYLQKKIDENFSLGSEKIYPKIKHHVLSLINDTFGNYLLQKVLENIDQDKLAFILKKITPKFLEAGRNPFGTRIIQKIIENLKDQNNLNYFNKLLEENLIDFIKDINGNHIIQKYLLEIACSKSYFLYDVAVNNIVEISTDKFGCCVIQKFIDTADDYQKNELIKKIIENTIILMSDPFGNYVVQYIILLKNYDVIYQISNTMKSYITYLSKQKFSSNVIEKCFDFSDERTRLLLIKEICIPKIISELILDAFGNYVIQKALHYSKEPYYTIFINSIGPILEKLKSLNFGHKLYLKLINTYPEFNSYISNYQNPITFNLDKNIKPEEVVENMNNLNNNINYSVKKKANAGQIPQNTACWLVAIGRGIGKLAENKNTCSENEELFEDNCVLKCPKNMIGKRNVCWSFCKDEYEQCGAICVKNQTCSGRIKEYVEKMFEKVEKFVKRKNFLGEVNLESLSEEFTFPKC